VSFDRIAGHYRWLEAVTFGHTLQNARTRWIETIAPPKHILVLGEGDGRFLCELLRVHSSANVDCVDASTRMLELARERLRKFLPHALDRVTFLHRDITKWSPSGSYDLLVANFVLDCFGHDEVNLIIRKVAQAAVPDAYLFLSDFCVSRKYFSRLHAKIWLAVMYWFFRTTASIRAKRLVDPTRELEANGFACLSRSRWRFGLVKSELWQLRRDSIQPEMV
jgi:ubiquinone/menaquinone biosynthesis C-methylase UbiE